MVLRLLKTPQSPKQNKRTVDKVEFCFKKYDQLIVSLFPIIHFNFFHILNAPIAERKRRHSQFTSNIIETNIKNYKKLNP